SPEMADWCEPCRRSDDHLRGHVRGYLSADSRRTCLARLVAVPDSALAGNLAAISFAAHVGRVRSLDLLHRFVALLVHGTDPRPRSDARSGENDTSQIPLRFVCAWLDRLEPPLEQLRKSLSDFGRSLHAASALRAQYRVTRLRCLSIAGMAHDHLP